MGTIQKWGNSLGVRVPKTYADRLGLSAGTEIEISLRDGELIIAPVYKTYALAELLAGCTPANRPDPIDWGPDVGREIL